MSATRLIIDGNAVYEIDEECMKRNRSMKSQEKPSSKNNSMRENPKNISSTKASK